MNAITLFAKDGVTVLLHDLQFDQEVDGVRASVQVQNEKDVKVYIEIVDLWDGETLYDDYCRSLCSVMPGETKKTELLELDSAYEKAEILSFQNGYLPPFSFRVALFTLEQEEDLLQFCSKGSKIVISKFAMDGVTVMPDECYAIQSDGETLFASSKYYIPFEISKANAIKAEQIRVFKEELTDRIDGMQIAPEDVLVAKYAETGKLRFFDIENMCIYNLGTSAFSRTCPSEIAFSQCTPEEVRLFGTPAEHSCFYAYSAVSRTKLEALCVSKRQVAQWDRICINTDIPNTPHRYWASIRNQFEKVDVSGALEYPGTDGFGIRVVVHLPKMVLPAGLMKPLLDGIVCAFHKRENMDAVLHRITAEHYDKMVAEAESKIAVLGETKYVKPYRANMKWNPADERLKFAWVSVVREDCEPYFEGKLFAWD